MGNTQCSDTCSNCTCLNLSSYEGAECTRLLKGEQTNILFFFGVLIMYVVLIVYFSCIKFKSNDEDSYAAQVLNNLADFFNVYKENISRPELISQYLFAIGLVVFLTSLIWRQYENMDYNCTTSDETDVQGYLDGINVLFYIFIGVIAIFVLQAFIHYIRICIRYIRS